MKTAYIAGPMRGYDQFNFPAFQEAATDMRRAGIKVLSPAERDIEAGFDPSLNSLEGFDVTAAMAADFAMILSADAIALLPGWEKSKGARAERFVAEQTGRDVFEYTPGTVSTLWHLVPAHPWDGNPRLPDDTHTAETRITNPVTGGAKGSKPARFDLLPTSPLWQVAELYGRGAEKYAPRNWEKGYDWSLSFAALMRHAWQFWSGEDTDAETGSHHLASAVFHCFSLMQFGETHPELDDRPKP